jgi:RHS repeat-associated protein
MPVTEQPSENSHRGFEGIQAALCLAEIEANSNPASKMAAWLRSNDTGSRCTGKERDAESGLDYFGARYFSGPQGRFTSPDRPFADQHQEDPQSWNLYSYVRNNPLKYVDDTGRGAISAAVRQARQAFVSYARREAVRRAWAQEREILQKYGPDAMTVRLTRAEQKELIERGAVTGWYGHHINSVKGNSLELARDPNNIKFVKGIEEHLAEHEGSFRNATSGSLIDRLGKLGGPALLTFFTVYGQKMEEYASQSPVVSSPDSWLSYINPVNALVENAALLEALAAAQRTQQEEDRRREEERKKKEQE